MGRHAKGGYRFKCRRGVYGIAFTATNGAPREVSLRTRDIEEAKRIAPTVYAEHVLEVRKEGASNFLVSPTTDLVGLVADWIVAIGSELGRDTDKTYITYGRHWKKHFKVLGDVKTSTVGNYQRDRLKEVIRDTVKLETYALRRFFKWLKEQEYLVKVPEFPEIAKKATGTRKPGRRVKPMLVLSVQQMEAIIEAIPLVSDNKVKGKNFPVRPWFIVARETGLRPVTIDNLIGRDVTVTGIHIRPENDKNRMERVIPYTPASKEALELVKPKDPNELVFGKHEWNYFFHKAALKALGPEIADRISKYDLKHGLVTELFDAGAPETGIQFLTGTVSAIRRYSHPTRTAAEEAIAARFRGHSGDVGTLIHLGQPKTGHSVAQSIKEGTTQKPKNAGKTGGALRKKTRV